MAIWFSQSLRSGGVRLIDYDDEVPVGVDQQRRVVGHPRETLVLPGRRELLAQR